MGQKPRIICKPLFFGENIIVDVQKQDGWGRYIAYVYTLENKDVTLEMLNAGMAWHYTKYDQSEKYHNAGIIKWGFGYIHDELHHGILDSNSIWYT